MKKNYLANYNKGKFNILFRNIQIMFIVLGDYINKSVKDADKFLHQLIV